MEVRSRGSWPYGTSLSVSVSVDIIRRPLIQLRSVQLIILSDGTRDKKRENELGQERANLSNSRRGEGLRTIDREFYAPIRCIKGIFTSTIPLYTFEVWFSN